MCLYNYNNKQGNEHCDNEENVLLKQIYKCISIQDNKKAIELTEQLISIQTSDNKINNLQEALGNLK